MAGQRANNAFYVSTDSRFRVSVIIPVLNDFKRLGRCLRALEEQTWSKDQLEVLVVDNGSDGDLAPLTERFAFVRLLREPVPGSYAARNRALEEVTGNVIAFTDSDCLPDPAWVERGVDAVQRLGPNAVIGGQVVLFGEDSQALTMAEEFELAIGFSQESYIADKHYSVTANLFTTPHVFAKVGRFDAMLKSGGDKEWGNRAHAKGIPLYFEATAIVRHPARRTLRELLHKRARVVGGHLAIASRQYPKWLAFALVLGKACLPPLQRVQKVARQPRQSAKRRLRRTAKVAAVGITLQAFSAFELVRLQLGKPPVR